MEVTFFNARLSGNPWRGAKHCLALLAPSEADLTFVNLPARLRALYYPLRALRLVAKHSARALGLRR
jgi:hypothetical protein